MEIKKKEDGVLTKRSYRRAQQDDSDSDGEQESAADKNKEKEKRRRSRLVELLPPFL